MTYLEAPMLAKQKRPFYSFLMLHRYVARSSAAFRRSEPHIATDRFGWGSNVANGTGTGTPGFVHPKDDAIITC